MAKKQNKTNKWNERQYCALWYQTSKSKTKYLTGVTEDGDRLVAFFNRKKKNPNEPDIRVYLSIDEEAEDDEEDDDLPF